MSAEWFFEGFKICFYWPEQARQTMRRYAEDLAAFLHEIGKVHPLLQRWYLTGDDPYRYDFTADFESGVEGFALDEQSILAEKNPIFGYCFGVWNAHEDKERFAYLDTSVGWTRRSSCLVLSLPLRNESNADLIQPLVLMELLRIGAQVFPLSWAMVTSGQYQKRLVFDHFRWVGWMAFVPALFEPATFPEADQVVRVGTKGTILVTTNDIFSSQNPEHIRKANRIEIRLADMGHLQKIG